MKNKDNEAIVIDGEEITVEEISEKYGIPVERILYRIDCGWKNEELITPVRKVKSKDTSSE